ncbi:hypothetical protein EMIHUDRAFT_459720 [Emiliania huxleyi CCMP1516]|uniref:PROP1-like PPR domain-containing protein n=2 Tax=Emiliania huxleyi TaxID=2903 RepID=A0A0D3IL13_EMIH1|nr:hypothetical protein EMIHUDRAFT_459720 [Emiliania huxleyi CCMP1516]EOD11948.1 hypothetical protein EMIHUDRAFT_459720 [Emiliania huxleyi CCMP1516]|eukprot:XP_005764377.1 hypothetical protein EMIHUDRAFT_459720 [Emiliania huxleyi CCMP1516]
MSTELLLSFILLAPAAPKSVGARAPERTPLPASQPVAPLPSRSALCGALKQTRNRQSIARLIAELEPQSQKEYTMCIAAWGRAGDWRRAVGLFDTMSDAGVEPNPFSVSAVVSACEKGGQPARALEIFEQARAGDRFESNVVVFNAALAACSRGGEWRRALDLLAEMQRQGLSPNCNSFNSAISACGRAGELDTALELLSTGMRAAGVEPDVVSWSAAIAACQRRGEWRRALELLDGMRRQGVAPNERTFGASSLAAHGAAISACAKGGAPPERALELLAEMRSSGLRVAVSAAINACGAAGDWKAALFLLDEIRRSGARPDLISWNAALAALDKGRQPRRAVAILDEMAAAGVQPDAVSYNTALLACQRAGEWDSVLELFERVRRAGGKGAPNAFSFNAALAACAATSRAAEAVALLGEMREAGAPPTLRSYAAVISACEAAGEWERALDILREAERAGVAPQLTPAVALQAGLVSLNALESRLLRALGRRT